MFKWVRAYNLNLFSVSVTSEFDQSTLGILGSLGSLGSLNGGYKMSGLKVNREKPNKKLRLRYTQKM